MSCGAGIPAPRFLSVRQQTCGAQIGKQQIELLEQRVTRCVFNRGGRRHNTCRPRRAGGANGTGRTRGTRGARSTCRTSRAGRPHRTGRPLRPNGSRRTLRADRANRAGCTRGTRSACGARGAGDTLKSLYALRARGADIAVAGRIGRSAADGRGRAAMMVVMAATA